MFKDGVEKSMQLSDLYEVVVMMGGAGFLNAGCGISTIESMSSAFSSGGLSIPQRTSVSERSHADCSEARATSVTQLDTKPKQL
jgi:hypothetical protein